MARLARVPYIKALLASASALVLVAALLAAAAHLPLAALLAAAGLLDLLLSCLGGLIYLVLDALILGRLIERAFKLHVGVGHLLDLGLRVPFGKLLGELLQL